MSACHACVDAARMRALKLLENEYRLTMGYVGCRTPDEVTRDVIVAE